jgi:hypothetical protein
MAPLLLTLRFSLMKRHFLYAAFVHDFQLIDALPLPPIFVIYAAIFAISPISI